MKWILMAAMKEGILNKLVGILAVLVLILASCNDYSNSTCSKLDYEGCLKPKIWNYEARNIKGDLRFKFIAIENLPDQIYYVRRKELVSFVPMVYDLIKLHIPTKKEQIITSLTDSNFNYFVAPNGNIFLRNNTSGALGFLNPDGEKLLWWTNTPNDSAIFTYFHGWNSRGDMFLASKYNQYGLVLYSYPAFDTIHIFEEDYYFADWKSDNKVYFFGYNEKIKMLDFSQNYNIPEEDYFNYKSLRIKNKPPQSFYQYSVFDSRILNTSEKGIEVVNIKKGHMKLVQRNRCNRIRNIHPVWNFLDDKIIFTKIERFANDEGEYQYEKHSLYQMNANGCNEEPFLVD